MGALRSGPASTPASVQRHAHSHAAHSHSSHRRPRHPPGPPPGGCSLEPGRPVATSAKTPGCSWRPWDSPARQMGGPCGRAPGPGEALAASAGTNSRDGCPSVPTAEAGRVLSTVPRRSSAGPPRDTGRTAPTPPLPEARLAERGATKAWLPAPTPLPATWPPAPSRTHTQRVQSGRHCPPPTLTPGKARSLSPWR